MNGTLVDRCDRCGAFLRPMTHAQHAAVEAVYEDMAAQLDYPSGSGQMLESWEWHQVMVASYAEYKGWRPKMLPTTEAGTLVPVMRQKQSRLTKKQGSELIEFTKAYAVNRGAVVREWDEDGKQVHSDAPDALQRAA